MTLRPGMGYVRAKMKDISTFVSFNVGRPRKCIENCGRPLSPDWKHKICRACMIELLSK